MTATLPQFRRRASVAIAEERLQQALDRGTGNFRRARDVAFAELPDADGLRDHFKAIRTATLADLGTYLQRWEANASTAGTRVHWARDGAEACAAVVEIAARRGATSAVKGKSMATEEIELNQALEAAGVTATETDLGDWLVQMAGETPSHIIAPAIHKTREQAAELIGRLAGRVMPEDDIPALTAAARELLRQRFLDAGIGITGGNLMVAETGSLVLVTNEGNGRMATSVPPVHVAVIGIEKVAPDWDAAAVWLSLLARSASGQPLSVYTSIVTGPRLPDDADGPEEVHVILLDNGRSNLLGGEYEEALQCIRWRLPQRLPGLRGSRRPCLRQPVLWSHRGGGDAPAVRSRALRGAAPSQLPVRRLPRDLSGPHRPAPHAGGVAPRPGRARHHTVAPALAGRAGRPHPGKSPPAASGHRSAALAAAPPAWTPGTAPARRPESSR